MVREGREGTDLVYYVYTVRQDVHDTSKKR